MNMMVSTQSDKLPDIVTDGNSQECVGDVICAPNDIISVEKRTNGMWPAIRRAQKIPRKKEQCTKGSTSELFRRRSYAEVAAVPA